MSISLCMPQLGLTMVEGTISRWLKQPGDVIKKGEALVEIRTDKIDNVVEAPVDGILARITAPEETIVPVRGEIAIILEHGEDITDLANIPMVPQSPDPAVIGTASVAPTEVRLKESKILRGQRVKISPLAKKTAAQHGLDVAQVVGTGPDGRIVERDVMQFIERHRNVKTTPMAVSLAAEHDVDPRVTGKTDRITKADVLQRPASGRPSRNIVPLTGMRKIIAERMTASWQVPHVTYHTSVDMGKARTIREKLLEPVEKKYSVRLTYTDFLVKACAAALRSVPGINVSLAENAIVYQEEINIGVAVATDNGLIVPVVRGADIRTLGETAKIIHELAGRGREGKLSPDDVTGGTFTVTNLGMHGVENFTPIINPPESAILGAGRIVEAPVVRDGAVTVAFMMQLSLSADHRTIDGVLAARFLQKVKQYLEEPLLLLC